MFLLCSAFLVLLIVALIKFSSKPKGFPPGPPRIPFLGGLPFMKGSNGQMNLFHGVRANVRKYGKILGFYLGRDPAVVISDFEVLRELLKKEETHYRPYQIPFNEFRRGWDDPHIKCKGLGVALSEGQYWKEQRRFALRHLRDFGFGKTSMEEFILVEAKKLAEMLRKEQNPTFLNHNLQISVVNTLWSIVVGEKLELDDPKLEGIVRHIVTFMSEAMPQSPFTQCLPNKNMARLPILREFAGYTVKKNLFDSVHSLIDPYVSEHRETIDSDHPRDFMDVYLNEISQTTDPGSSFYGKRGTDAMVNMLVDFYVAGMETTSSSLLWAFLFMVHHRDLQKKVHEEIDNVIGQDRNPSLADEANMPFTCAVLHESMRHVGLLYLSVPHYTETDIDVGGYKVPAGTTILSDLWGIQNDPDYWKEPESFNPDRFIDPSTGKFVPDERVIPFSTGKRYCLGKLLAEKQFFLFFVQLMQKFEFEPAPGKGLPSYDVEATNPVGVIRAPEKFWVNIIERS